MKKLFGKLQYNSPVTLNFAFVSLIVLLLGEMTGNISTNLLFSVYSSSWMDPLTYFRVLSHSLGHADWNHYANNMLLFLVLGPTLEEKYKSKPLLIMIIVTTLVSGLFYIILYPSNVLLGASGIVFMMIVLSSIGGMKEGKIPLTLILVLIIYVGGEFISIGSHDGIARGAHILGGICGVGFGLIPKRG